MTPVAGILEARGDLVSAELDLRCLEQGVLELDEKIAHVYEQLRSSVYHYLVLVTGNAAEAEEITQETLEQRHATFCLPIPTLQEAWSSTPMNFIGAQRSRWLAVLLCTYRRRTKMNTGP